MSRLILDLDIGNSRTKWKLSGEKNHAGVVDNLELAGLPDLVGCRPCRVRAACVANEVHRIEIQQDLCIRWNCVIEFAETVGSCAGLINKYDNPAQLGVDRWLAALGAWHAAAFMPSLVIDAGSALTIDTIDENGNFLGGYIIPGLIMMQKCLVTGTGKIRCEDKIFRTGVLTEIPTNTTRAVQLGAFFALCSSAQNAIDKFLMNWPHGTVQFTGGDGEDIAQALGMANANFDPDLVFKGLALALP